MPKLLIILIALLISPLAVGNADETTQIAQANIPMQKFTSRHGFSINYPSGWRLTSFAENYETLQDAQRVGGNFVEITSYAANDAAVKSANVFTPDKLKVEVWIYPNYNTSLGILITQLKGIQRLNNFTIDGNKAKRVWQTTSNGSGNVQDMLSIYYVDKGNKVIFAAYPAYTSKIDEFEAIAGSFRFTK